MVLEFQKLRKFRFSGGKSSFHGRWQNRAVLLTLSNPWTVARQPPLSMGFSRQEHWSGLSCPPPGDLPNPGIETRSPTLQADSSPPETPGKHKSTVVGSLFLFQAIFLTQESNQGLHCRQILHHLSDQGSPTVTL